MNNIKFHACIICCFFLFIKPLYAKTFNEKCLSKCQTEVLIENILNDKRISKYLHADLPERSPIKIKCNDDIRMNYEMFYMSKEILVTNNENHEDIIEIKLRKKNCTNSQVYLLFNFISKIEGVAILGSAEWIDEMWKIEILKEVLI